jgi:phosphopantetheinyl transferase
MKNSKRKAFTAWVEEHFLSPQQLTSCRALFRLQNAEPALTVIDLSRLQANLTAPGRSLAANWLDPSELERLNSFHFPKRQLEWLGGRLAAKHAAGSLMTTDLGLWPPYTSLRVDNDASGRPLLTCQTEANTTPPEISISHSGNYAGALAVTGHSCGLDLQRLTAKVITVRERFADQSELELINENPALHDVGEAAALTLLWSAKEAFRKAIACQPLMGFTELILSRLEGDPQAGLIGHFSCPRLAAPLPPAFMVLRQEFACAITVNDVGQEKVPKL